MHLFSTQTEIKQPHHLFSLLKPGSGSSTAKLTVLGSSTAAGAGNQLQQPSAGRAKQPSVKPLSGRKTPRKSSQVDPNKSPWIYSPFGNAKW